MPYVGGFLDTSIVNPLSCVNREQIQQTEIKKLSPLVTTCTLPDVAIYNVWPDCNSNLHLEKEGN